MKAIANVSVIPIRAENSDKSEIISQLLFGESVDILQVEKNWTKIKTHFDHYEGWVDSKQISNISEEAFAQRKTKTITENFIWHNHLGQKHLLSIGSEIEEENTHKESNTNDIRGKILETAKAFLNTPYLWGGRSFFGIDCSGFTQIVYKANGIKIPRDAYQQATCGMVLNFIEETEEGDLAFFENEEGKIVHVGIMLNNQKIIHAHGKVRIDDLDSIGIFNKEQNKHTHKLRFVKRILD